jgi:hypothetical protein
MFRSAKAFALLRKLRDRPTRATCLTRLTRLTRPTCPTCLARPTYFAANVSGLNAGLTLIVLHVVSSVGLPSTEREMRCGSCTPSTAL